MFLFPLAVRAVVAASEREILKGEQRGDVAVGNYPDISTCSSISAVWASARDVSFTTERHASCASVSTFRVKVALVDETRHRG
jgi:uncharacterized membrane protein